MFAYIDLGFEPIWRNSHYINENLENIDIEEVINKVFLDKTYGNITRVGNSIILNITGITAKTSHGKEVGIPAHLNDFVEIMSDGSVRLRLLLYNKDNSFEINMLNSRQILAAFKYAYEEIFGDKIEDNFIYAKKYEKLTVLKQFSPSYYYTDEFIGGEEKLRNINIMYKNVINEYTKKTGKDLVITDDRIPKVGLSNIDRAMIEKKGLSFVKDDILFMLFYSQYTYLGYVKEQDEINERHSG